MAISRCFDLFSPGIRYFLMSYYIDVRLVCFNRRALQLCLVVRERYGVASKTRLTKEVCLVYVVLFAESQCGTE